MKSLTIINSVSLRVGVRNIDLSKTTQQLSEKDEYNIPFRVLVRKNIPGKQMDSCGFLLEPKLSPLIPL